MVKVVRAVLDDNRRGAAGSVALVGIRNFEQRLERMVEGAFARVFKSGLRPVELARRLVREMDSNRSVGVSGDTVAPNHFYVYVSEDDHERFAEVEGSLARELAEAAREHARDEGYHFMGPVAVELLAADYPTGSFQIVARLKEGDGSAPGSLVLPTGDRVSLGTTVLTFGRLPECTVVLADPNASRHHAEIRPTASGYQLVDLGSTNGTKVNGAPVTEHILVDGDELTFGATVVRFEAS